MRSREVLEVAADRSRNGFRERLGHLRALRRTILQASLAAGLAWLVVTEVVGHQRGFFGPVAALITLGLTVGQRLRRAIEVSLGVSLGIALGDVLVIAVGSGVWQVVLITTLAMAAAVLVGGGPTLVQQSAVSAVLVVTLQPPTEGISFARSIDGVIGCTIALTLSYLLLPVDPVALLRREAEPVLRELAATLRDVAAALERRDRAAAAAALVRARGVDEHAARLKEALAVARETTGAATAHRRSRATIDAYAVAGDQLDLAVRNVRVLARGAVRALDVGDHVPPEVAGAVRALGDAVACLRPWLLDPTKTEAARAPAIRAAREATAVLERTGNLSVTVIVAQIRSAAVDLLRTTGVPAEEARALVRAAAPVD